MKKIKNETKGFTLIELLVVVVIIGILAAIALPQYQMAVTKAKVASMLPLMRRFKDAVAEYKLQHGIHDLDLDYETGAATLGVNWPSDWKYENGACGNKQLCSNDYWYDCNANEDTSAGYVYCQRETSDGFFSIYLYQPDYQDNEKFRDKITCYADGDEAHKICKALGGKLPEGEGREYILY